MLQSNMIYKENNTDQVIGYDYFNVYSDEIFELKTLWLSVKQAPDIY